MSSRTPAVPVPSLDRRIMTKLVSPKDLWLRDWNDSIIDYPDLYAQSRRRERLCRKHAATRPVSITFVQRVHSGFKPEDWLNGKRPLDAEFARRDDGADRPMSRPMTLTRLIREPFAAPWPSLVADLV